MLILLLLDIVVPSKFLDPEKFPRDKTRRLLESLPKKKENKAVITSTSKGSFNAFFTAQPETILKIPC